MRDSQTSGRRAALLARTLLRLSAFNRIAAAALVALSLAFAPLISLSTETERPDHQPAPAPNNLVTVDFLSNLSALNSTRAVRLEDISRAMAAEKAAERAGRPGPEIVPAKPERPEPPERVFAVFQDGDAHIIWDASARAARGYNVYRVGPDRCFELLTPNPVKTERYTDPAPGVYSNIVYYIEAVGADKSKSALSVPSAVIKTGLKIVP